MRKSLVMCFFLLLTACNMPLTSNDEDLNNQAATVVALTLDAQVAATPTLEETPLPTPTLAVTATPKPTITPTYSVPMLTVNENTNCRSGPGQSFDILTTLVTGASVEIIGKHPTENYWVVKVQGMDEPCWLWGEFSTTSGSFWVVPTMSPPATAAAQPAGQPTNLNYTYECTFNGANSDVAVRLTWNDLDNELSYRIYRDNAQIAELSANTTSFSETTAADPTQKLTYGVSALNSVGESPRATISFSCQ